MGLFLEKIKNLRSVGTVVFSSKAAVEGMTKSMNNSSVKRIVEFGGGDGCITKGALAKMGTDGRIISYEINEEFIQLMNQIEDPRLRVINRSAEILPQSMKEEGWDKVDLILSSLPLSLMPKELVNTILKTAEASLRPGGLFVQIQYSLVTKKNIGENIWECRQENGVEKCPPCWILTCEKI